MARGKTPVVAAIGAVGDAGRAAAKPGAGGASRKVSYAVTADMAFSAGIQIGAGIYDEKLTPVALNRIVETLADPDKYPAH